MAGQPWGQQPYGPKPQPWKPGPAPQPPYASPVPYASPQSPFGAQAAMRAAHADRERTVDVLKAAYAEGRLTAEEYSQRFDAVHRAQTYGQLSQLVADLPSGPVVAPQMVMLPMSAAGHPVPQTFLPPPVPYVPARTNGLAIASLVLGLLCLPTMGTLGLPAVVTGHIAKSQLRRSGEEGDGMATAGLVIGWLSVAGWAMIILMAAVAGL